MDALILCAVIEVSMNALLAVFMGGRIVKHMIGAKELVVVSREKDTTGLLPLLTPLDCLEDYGGGQLIVEIIQVNYVGLEIIQNKPNLLTGFLAIYGLDGICELLKRASTVKVHIAGVGINCVSYASSLMLHTEVLNFVAQAFKRISKSKYVCF